MRAYKKNYFAQWGKIFKIYIIHWEEKANQLRSFPLCATKFLLKRMSVLYKNKPKNFCKKGDHFALLKICHLLVFRHRRAKITVPKVESNNFLPLCDPRKSCSHRVYIQFLFNVRYH
jgi:hypothetical protein